MQRVHTAAELQRVQPGMPQRLVVVVAEAAAVSTLLQGGRVGEGGASFLGGGFFGGRQHPTQRRTHTDDF